MKKFKTFLKIREEAAANAVAVAPANIAGTGHDGQDPAMKKRKKIIVDLHRQVMRAQKR